MQKYRVVFDDHDFTDVDCDTVNRNYDGGERSYFRFLLNGSEDYPVLIVPVEKVKYIRKRSDTLDDIPEVKAD